MSVFTTVFAAQAPLPANAWDMVATATITTRVILVVLLGFSLASWILIIWKWIQFRRIRLLEEEFLSQVAKAQHLDEAYKAVITLPDSPYLRVFRHGMNFFTGLHPRSESSGLSAAQVETLRLVMEKEQVGERDAMAHGLPWLAIIATVSPLLGLMGTVVGVMDAFVGISAMGTANITAVAPGIAEALITTVTGLGVAIPAVIGYNHFASRLGLFAGELQGFAHEFIGALAREGKI
ncbi:MAG: MotA/TolQ/ExbB proton channel family protein [Gemmatimonadota bacterium]|nr:MAG: MotA/TolQ/ExbB proton channel family protein [Gemmatimonadota bacterium]